MARRSDIGRRFESSDERERQVLRDRLRRELGRVQVAEILRGAYLGQGDWQAFCNEVLQARPPLKVRELLEVVDEAALVCAMLSETAQELGWDEDCYWFSGGAQDAAWETWLTAQAATDISTGIARDADRSRLAAQERTAGLMALASRGGRELDRPFRELFEDGPPTSQAQVAAALTRHPLGQARLLRLVRKASLLTLGAIHAGIAALAGEEAFVAEALKAVWGRLHALRDHKGTDRGDWLAIAIQVLPAQAATMECVLELGRSHSDPANAIACDYLCEPQPRQAELLEGVLARWTMLVLVMGDEEGLAGIRVHDEALQWARQWPRHHPAADEHLRDCVWGTLMTAGYAEEPEQLAELVAALHWVEGERPSPDTEDVAQAPLPLARLLAAPIAACEHALRKVRLWSQGKRRATAYPHYRPGDPARTFALPFTAEQVARLAARRNPATGPGAVPLVAPFPPDWLWDVYIDLVEVCTDALGARAVLYVTLPLSLHLPARIYGRLLNAVLDLGEAAVETLREALKEMPGRGVLVALDWLEAEGIEDDLVPLLGNPDALIRREAIILLAQRADRRVVPAARALCAAEEPAERVLGLFAFCHPAVDEGLGPALAALDDPHPAVRSMALSVLLRTALPQRAAALREAIAGSSGLQAEGALTVACSLGGEEGATALPEPAQVQADLAARLPKLRKRLLKEAPLDPDELPAFRRPPSHPGPLPAHWQAYWADAQRDPVALKWHDRLCNTSPPLSDEDWFEARERFVDHRTLHWLLRDLSADAESQVRLAVAAHCWSDATTAPDALWLEAWRIVSPAFLRDKWWRGRDDRLLAEPTAPHALLAVCTVYAGLLQEHWSGTRLARELLVSEDGYLMAHWRWLARFTNAYWGFAVTPAIPLPRLAQFVNDHWKRLQSARTPEGATARQILDYLSLQCTLQPGLVQWRDACREALWEALGPMRRGLWGKYQRATARLVGRMSQARFGAELRDRFAEALETYDPFWSGPEQPLFPLGDLRWRSQDQNLPRTLYGRGIPFVRYLRARLADLLPEKDGAPVTTSPPQDRRSAKSTKRPRAPRFDRGKQAVVDENGTQWVTIRWLSRETGLTEDVLRDEERRGFLHFTRRQKMRVLLRSQVETQGLVLELQARSLLRSTKRLSERYKGSRRTILRHVAELRSGHTAMETLKLLATRLEPQPRAMERDWTDDLME